MSDVLRFECDIERGFWMSKYCPELGAQGAAKEADEAVQALRARSTSLIHRGTRAVSRDAIVASIAAEGLALSAEDAVRVATGVDKAFQEVNDGQ